MTNQIKVTVPVLSGYNYEVKLEIFEGREFFSFAKNELKTLYQMVSEKSFPGSYLSYCNREEEEINDSQEIEPPLDEDEIEAKAATNRRLMKIRLAIDYYGISQNKWNILLSQEEKQRTQNLYYLFFDRFHYAIGHYFRNLYHILDYVDNYRLKLLEVLPDNEKASREHEAYKQVERYAKFIQAQMSTYELMLLYYNALCFDKTFTLLKKYNFLENLAEDDLVAPKHNFPDCFNLKKRSELVHGREN